MKKYICVLFITLAVASFCSCSTKTIEEVDEQKIKNICEMATLECYFNNLAMKDLFPEEGLKHSFEIKRTLWIEYTGEIKLGIDMQKVSIKSKENKIIITIPHAKVLTKDFNYKTLDNCNIVISKDSWINKNEISVEEQLEAINEAQKKMVKSINANDSMMKRAEERAKILIENYINQIGEISGVNYEIEWKFIETKE